MRFSLPTRPFALPVLAVLGLTLALAACGDSARPAATVEGVEITQEQLVDELEAIEGNADYLAAREQSGPVLGSEPDTFDAGFVAQTLRLRVLYTLFETENDRRDVVVDDACLAAGRDATIGELAAASPDGDGEAILAAFGEDYADYLVRRNAELVALQGALAGFPCVTDDAAEQYFAEHTEDFRTACVSLIQVADLPAAEQVAADLAAGADFATLASERSQDTQSAALGGDIGCVSRSVITDPAFQAAIFDLEPGQVGEPLETEFGVFIFRLSAFEEPDLEAQRAEVSQAVSAAIDAAFSAWFTDAAAAAEIDVDPRIGTWNPDTLDIDRPASSTTTSTLPGDPTLDPSTGETAPSGG